MVKADEPTWLNWCRLHKQDLTDATVKRDWFEKDRLQEEGSPYRRECARAGRRGILVDESQERTEWMIEY